MMNQIVKDKAEETIQLGSDKFIILINGFDDIFNNISNERARNVFLIDSVGNVIWRIHSNFDEDGGRFLGISYANEVLLGVRWDGGQYSIDIKTGFATPKMLLK